MTKTAKEEYEAAHQAKRDIEKWIKLPRCYNCENYEHENACAKFGPIPPHAVHAIHVEPCPLYAHDDIPF